MAMENTKPSNYFLNSFLLRNSENFYLQKITTRLFTILIISISLLSCKEEKKSTPEPNSDGNDENVENYDKGILLPEEARELYTSYQNRRVGLIERYEDSINASRKGQNQQNPEKKENNEDFIVAEYIWYEYEDIKKYLAYIEKEAELSGEKISTLRFYFGNNPEKQKFDNGDTVVHPRQNTIMISPTIKGDVGESLFYTIDISEDKRTAVLLTDEFQERKVQKGNPEQSGIKSEASFAPNLYSASEAPVFSPNGTTKNRGSGSPPNNEQ